MTRDEHTREEFEVLTHQGKPIGNPLARYVLELLEDLESEVEMASQKQKSAEADAGAFERSMQQASIARNLLELRLKSLYRWAPWWALIVSAVTAAAMAFFGVA